MVIPPPSAAPS